jgi:cytidyltransferase-like protein
MLTETELNNLRTWKYKVEDNSVGSRLCQPMWNYMTSFFPKYVHPNLITASGFLCLLYAYTLTIRFPPSLPLTLVVIVLTLAYMNLDAIDGKQARKTNNSSPIGELFDHALDNVGMVMTLMAAFNLWQVKDRVVISCMIFSVSTLFLMSHLEAYLSPTKTLVFHKYDGPTEVILVYCLILLASTIRDYLPDFVYVYAAYIPFYLSIISVLYVLYIIARTALSWHRLKGTVQFTENDHIYTVFGFTLCFVIRALASFVFPSDPNGQIGYLAEGLILSIPTTEIILCKMSNKPYNPIIVVLIMASLVDNFLAIILCIGYYVYMFMWLSEKLRIPLFQVKTRIYCCGVFDMCHRGHMMLFQRAASLGNELIVGVHNDEDVASYKRKPNVSHEERCETVAVCKYVSEVIPNAPLYLDEDFLKKHRIDTVVCSDEYDSLDDKYYAVPRRMGTLKVLTRTSGISSSDLMRIVMSRQSGAGK